MSQEKYIGMDVHQATISVAVTDSRGKLIMESILETKAATIQLDRNQNTAEAAESRDGKKDEMRYSMASKREF